MTGRAGSARPHRTGGPCTLAVFIALATAFPAGAEEPAIVIAGEASPGARAVLQPVIDGFATGTLLLRDEWPPAPAAEAVIDPDGDFALRAPGAGMWRVVVEAPGRLPMHQRILPLTHDLRLPAVELPADAGCTVRLVDERGRPVPGARVRADPLRGPPPLRTAAERGWHPATRRATSGPDGTLRLPAAAGEELAVAGRAGGAVFEAVFTVEPPCRQTLRALPAATVRLEVRSAADEPVAGALIDAGERPLPVARSGDDGSATATLTIGEPAPVTVRTADGLELSTMIEPVPEGAPLRLELPRTVRLTGRVLDESSERPLAGALVWDAADVLRSTRAGPDGAWFLLAAAPGPPRVQAAATGYLENGLRRTPDRTSSIDLRLRPSVSLGGTVTDLRERGLEGAHLEIGPAEGGRPPLPADRSAADGSWRIAGIDDRTDQRLTVELAGFVRHEIVLNRGGVTDGAHLRVFLEPAAEVLGRLTTPAGEPEAAVTVLLGAVAVPGTEPPPDRQLSMTLSAPDGGFRFEGLAAGRYQLLAARGEQPLFEVARVDVPFGGGVVRLGTLVVGARGSVEVTVADTSGRPIEGAEVAAAGRGGRETSCVTGSRGCLLTALPERGEVRIAVRADGFAAVAVPGVRLPADEPLAVTLQRGARVRGRVIDAEKRPLPGARVEVTVETDPGPGAATTAERSATAGDDGSFEVEAVPAGRFEASAGLDGHLPSEVSDPEFDPLAGEPLVFRLQPAASIEGTVLNQDGNPVEGARVSAVVDIAGLAREPGAPVLHSQAAVSGSDGGFRLDGLAPRGARVTVRHPAYPPLVREIDLGPGSTRVELVVESGVEVAGWVVGASGDAVPGARVAIDLGGPRRPAIETASGDDGSFSFPRVPPGRHTIRAGAAGFAPGAREPLEVGREPIHGLELELHQGARILAVVTGLEPALLPGVTISALGPLATRRGAAVNADGEFTLERLPPGEWYLQARLAQDERRAERRVEIPPGGGDHQVEIEFEPGEILRGRLTAAGAPVAGAILSFTGLTSRASFSTRSGPAGGFEAGPLPAGSYRLSVIDPSSALRHARTVEVGARPEIEIALSTGEIAGLAVFAETLQPAAGVQVRLVSPGAPVGPPPATVSTSDGSFRFRRVVAGDYRLVAEHAGQVLADVAVAVTADGLTGPVELELEGSS
jgi:protocatechuate 3,4-dioxygenase beta subunit